MKFTTFFSLFLLCGFTSYLPSATAIVLDSDGNFLDNGGTYFIRQFILQNGGGVHSAITGNETCPLSVVQNPRSSANGLPVRISSPIKFPYIQESFILDIGFTFVAPCAPTPSTWTVVKGEGDRHPVKLTGYNNTIVGGFRIKRVSVDIGGYNLLFCPLDSPCGYVAVDLDSRRNRILVVTQEEKAAMWIQFQRVNPLPPTATATAHASA
ncbi:kunitz-type trypsin inhibitor KTI1-like [Vigna unguiculata]|uniref:Kunitz inhibitor ST1-like n=1 Tax=Vigna unguiculata TaxID=3917 RepID=A0A4D6NEB7_VIGUN|nr:kunitz-type trypsin inhibitor KTI1-like [Vigna unguiculata]QCE11211.1 Kunitz inhibitor ST1-like [Vigna unguiculata]